ncbi:MAG: hypothetical protein KAS32_13125 [Candidatus Peribacteraceae bacterium]|nr:hypothetical protein [Candidatus Peribacteraceae bacterium]
MSRWDEHTKKRLHEKYRDNWRKWFPRITLAVLVLAAAIKTLQAFYLIPTGVKIIFIWG